jgi:hypothetical protein
MGHPINTSDITYHHEYDDRPEPFPAIYLFTSIQYHRSAIPVYPEIQGKVDQQTGNGCPPAIFTGKKPLFPSEQ